MTGSFPGFRARGSLGPGDPGVTERAKKSNGSARYVRNTEPGSLSHLQPESQESRNEGRRRSGETCRFLRTEADAVRNGEAETPPGRGDEGEV